MTEKSSQFPYITISPHYRKEYDFFVMEELGSDEIIVAAVDFAENYLGSHPYFYWGFILITDHRFVKCYIERETSSALVYKKTGSRWRRWFYGYGEPYSEYKWSVPSDLFTDNQQMECDSWCYQYNYDLGKVLLSGDHEVVHNNKKLRLTQLDIIVCDSPEEDVGYHLTFHEEDGRLVYVLLHHMNVLFAIKKTHENVYLTDEEFSRAKTKLFERLEEELETHVKYQAYLKNLEEESSTSTNGTKENHQTEN